MSAVSFAEPGPRHVSLSLDSCCTACAVLGTQANSHSRAHLGGESLTFSALAQPQRPLRCTCPSLSCSAHETFTLQSDVRVHHLWTQHWLLSSTLTSEQVRMLVVVNIAASCQLKQDTSPTRPEVLGDSDSMPRGCATGVELPEELPLHR
jgi:hypothetical protein